MAQIEIQPEVGESIRGQKIGSKVVNLFTKGEEQKTIMSTDVPQTRVKEEEEKPEELPEKKKSRWWIWLVIILLILGGAVAAYFFYFKGKGIIPFLP